MQILVYLWLALLSQPAASAEDWFACQKSAECKVDEDQCHRPLAIHKKFLKANQELNERERPLIQCLEYKGKPLAKYRAICKGEVCSLTLR